MTVLYNVEKCLRGVMAKPNVAVDSGYCDNIGVWACASTCGYRPYMEDRYVVSKFRQEELFLAVFDGHGMPGSGHVVSEYCEANFADLLSKQISNINNNGSASISGAPNTPLINEANSQNSKVNTNDHTRQKNQSISTDMSYVTAID